MDFISFICFFVWLFKKYGYCLFELVFWIIDSVVEDFVCGLLIKYEENLCFVIVRDSDGVKIYFYV